MSVYKSKNLNILQVSLIQRDLHIIVKLLKITEKILRAGKENGSSEGGIINSWLLIKKKMTPQDSRMTFKVLKKRKINVYQKSYNYKAIFQKCEIKIFLYK